LIIYTSGTTGNPKGCLHAHRVLPGHMPGVEYPHSMFPKENDLFWTPAVSANNNKGLGVDRRFNRCVTTKFIAWNSSFST
jgi:acyl-CoA synthetase (AMP-forming)/AMP-acid ligase II